MARKIQMLLGALVILVLIPMIPIPAHAFFAEDLLPGDPIKSPLYEKYSPDKLRIDYVGREEPDGITEHMEERMYEFINMILNFLWWLYMINVEMTIRMVNWAFSKELTNDLIDLLPSLLPAMESSIWEYLWKLGAAVSVLGAIILWAYGRTQKMVSTMVGLLLILAIAPIVFQYLPAWLKTVNDVSTELSGRIMVTMVKADHSKYVSQKDEDEYLKARDGFYDAERNKKIMEEYRNKTTLAGIEAVDDAIWKSLVYEPYLFINFVHKDIGEEHIDNLILKNEEERVKYFREWIGGDGKVKDGEENEKFIFFTREWFIAKAALFFFVVLVSFVPSFALLGFSFVVLYWTGVAIGRAIMGVIHFVLALWPGYGFSEVGNWMYQTFAALIMKLFYSIVLSIFLAIWILIQPGGEALPSLGLIGRVIVVVFLLVGFWSAVEAIRNKTLNAPGLSGGSMASADTGQSEFGMFKRFMSMTGRKVAQPAGNLALQGAQGISKVAGKGATKGGTALARVGLNKLKQRNLPKAIIANMSEEGRKAFRQMKRRGLDPLNEADRNRFTKDHPNLDGAVEEIARWSEMKQEDRAKITEGEIPVPPPPKNSPEYEVWRSNPEMVRNYSIYRQAKKRVHDQKYQEFNEQRKRYESSIFRRLIQRRPRFVEPSQRAYLREYRRMLNELNNK